jgi:hypothetical protein
MTHPYVFAQVPPDRKETRDWPWQFTLEYMNYRHFLVQWAETDRWCRERFGSPHNPLRDNRSRTRHRLWMRLEYRFIFRNEQAAMEFKMRWC